jgi:hypothetical protein
MGKSLKISMIFSLIIFRFIKESNLRQQLPTVFEKYLNLFLIESKFNKPTDSGKLNLRFPLLIGLRERSSIWVCYPAVFCTPDASLKNLSMRISNIWGRFLALDASLMGALYSRVLP